MNPRHAIEYVGTDFANERNLYVLELASPHGVPNVIDVRGDYFAALIAWDSRGSDVATISRLARCLIDAGGVCFCSWGPDCERVHDIIDEEWVANGFDPTSDSTIITTWHDEPLTDAIWYAIFHAIPCDRYLRQCRSVVAVSIGIPDAATEIRTAFSDPEQFNNVVLGSDD